MAHAIIAIGAASAMYRFFPHYYLPAMPFVTIALADWLNRIRIPGRDVVRQIGGVITLVTIVIGAACAYTYERIDGEVTHNSNVKRVARYIEVTSLPEASIFVWGFSPWLYGYSHRKPAGRYVFETYVTGFVPWFFDDYRKEKNRVVPGSLENLVADLDRERPELVVDAGSVLLARPMRAYALAATWLHNHYCFELRVSGYDIYRRKRANADCGTSAFPLPHVPIDYDGKLLSVPMPVVVDEATSRPLCSNIDDDPVWFPDSVSPPQVGLSALSSHNRDQERQEHRAQGIVYPNELKAAFTCP
jgi:hypothetical protein